MLDQRRLAAYGGTGVTHPTDSPLGNRSFYLPVVAVVSHNGDMTMGFVDIVEESQQSRPQSESVTNR